MKRNSPSTLVPGPALIQLLAWLAMPAAAQAQFTYVTNNDSITITGYTCPTNPVAVGIPGMIAGLPVLSIGANAFSYCTGVTSFSIPNSVTSIGRYAFNGCTTLTNVTIPKSVTIIGEGAFYNCKSLTAVAILSGITNIEDDLFYGCTGLISVTISATVTNVGDYAFLDCTGLVGVYFEGNAPGVGSHVFDNDNGALVYYLPGTTGWGSAFGGPHTALWQPRLPTTAPAFGVRKHPFRFNIDWADGRVVVVEAATNASNAAWIPLATNTLTSGSSFFSDPQWTNYAARFYRLRTP